MINRSFAARACVAAVLLFDAPMALPAQVVSGTFTVMRACDAYQSFNKGTNPGSIKTRPGAEYEAREVNSVPDYSWVRISIPDVEPTERWVSRECGVPHFEVAAIPVASPAGENGDDGNACDIAGTHDSYVLAITWQPGFCEHFPYNGKKPECDAMATGDLVVSNLTLHGLWPNKKSCGTKYGHCHGSPLDLSEDTVSKIAPWMPNFFFEQTFGQYEWRKHGTCQSLDDDAYFTKAVDALKVVNQSKLGQYIRDHLGENISIKQAFSLIEQDAGTASAKNVTFVCGKGKYLQELRFGLPLAFRIDQGLTGLLAGGSQLPRVSGCSSDSAYIEASGPN